MPRAPVLNNTALHAATTIYYISTLLCLSTQICGIGHSFAFGAIVLFFYLTFVRLHGIIINASALLAQLDRVTGYEPVGRGFESLAAHH